MAYQKTFFDTYDLPLHLTDCSVDSLQKPFIDRLATAVAIPSVSADASYRPEVHKMGEWLASELEALSVKSHPIQFIANIRVEKRPLGKHNMQGVELELPPIILGRYGSDPKKKTVLVYGHYDVYLSI
jgi:Cys-Gly metallodipeptidase DUG1